MSVREYGKYGFASILMFIIIGASGSITLIWICKGIEKWRIGTILAVVGRNTIPILALHLFLLYFVELCISKVVQIPLDNQWIRFGYGYFKIILVIILCIVFAKGLNYIKEFIKGNR